MYVILFGRVPCDHCPWCIKTYHTGTILPPSLDLTEQGHTPTPILTSSNLFIMPLWNTYLWQAGGWHSTGMIFFQCFLSVQISSKNVVWSFPHQFGVNDPETRHVATETKSCDFFPQVPCYGDLDLPINDTCWSQFLCCNRFRNDNDEEMVQTCLR